MPEPTKTPSHSAEPDAPDEVSRQREEILRLRDLLIAKDAELGAARGRLAEIEAGPLQKLKGPTPPSTFGLRLPWIVIAVVRRLLR